MESENKIIMTEEEILNKLIGGCEAPKSTFLLKRLGVQITLKGLTEKEISILKVQCTYDRKLNEDEFNSALILAATTNFNWNNEKLLNAYGASSGKALIGKILLAGEIVNLTRLILELSGFSNSIEKVEDTIKNL